MIRAVYDACVLYSASLRDFLMWLGVNEVVCPLWSSEIQSEWIYSLIQNRPDLGWKRQERTRREMNATFPDSLVTGYEHLIPALWLPDLNDRHVLAVAIHAKAEYIVTFNLTDFPKTVLHPYGIEALSPDEFALRLIGENLDGVLRTAKRHRLNLVRPPKTADEYLATLKKQGLSKTVDFLRDHEADI